jgi:hypothetical protein
MKGDRTYRYTIEVKSSGGYTPVQIQVGSFGYFNLNGTLVAASMEEEK